ncbi:MAG: hypothetical protein LBT14_09630, partial [Treponema sp.]|nr:hypothetical protein [Treponema sp.]
MKRQKNWRKVSSVVLGLMAAGIIALLAGCPSPESPGRTGVVRVSIGEVARTLLPENPIFTKYELTFTPSSGTAVTTEVLNPVAGSAIEVA